VNGGQRAYLKAAIDHAKRVKVGKLPKNPTRAKKYDPPRGVIGAMHGRVRGSGPDLHD